MYIVPKINKIIGDTAQFAELMNIHDYIKPIEAPLSNFDLHPVEDYLLSEDQCKQSEEKRKRGRPKGSKNKPKTILNNPIDFTENE